MITRNGFVSNSSSSSFIVNFPHKPESKEDLAEMMGDCYSKATCCHSNDYSKEAVVEVVWNDIQKFLTRDNNEPVLRNIILTDDDDEDIMSYDLAQRLEPIIQDILYELPWDERKYNEKYVLESLCSRIQAEIKKAEHRVHDSLTGDTFQVRLNYADDGGEGWLEHGEIFRNLPHEVISHH